MADDRAKRIYTTEIIDQIIEDYKNGYEYDAAPFKEGDVELRAPNISFEYTPEELMEFQKCMLDAEYFISTYCKFQTDTGRQAVKLRDYQRDIINTVSAQHYDEKVGEMVPDNKNVCIMASRQIGKTTTTAAFMAHYLCFNVDKNIMVLANKDATAKEIVDKIIQIFRGLPYFLKPGAVNFGKTGLNLDNGCRLLSAATTASTSIGFTIHKLYIDEFAHIPNNIIEPFWRSVYPTLSSSAVSQCIISSTPNGTNMFYDIFSKSTLGTRKNSFVGIRVDYWQVPGHDEEWAKAMKADFGEEFFAQEFELQFNVNSRMLLKGTDFQFMNKIQKEFIQKEYNNPNDILLQDRYIRWHPNFDPNDIKPEDKFLLSIDLAEGDEDEDIKNENDKSDYNIINIFKIVPNSIANIKAKNLNQPITTVDCVKLIQVGIYEDNDKDEAFCANVCSSLLYNVFKVQINDNVRIIVEMNFQGKNFVTNMQKSELFFDDIIIKTYHTAYVPGEKRRKKFGFKTKSDKEHFCKIGANSIAKKRIIITDKKSVTQLSCFGKVNGKLKGIASHDDIAMTILNNLTRALAETTFVDWIDENVIEVIKDETYKFKLNELIKKWSMDNPETSDDAFNSLYKSNNNDYYFQQTMYNNVNSGYQTYSQLLNRK